MAISETPLYTVKQGDIVVSEERVSLNAIAGSSVVVAIWDRSRRVGGMVHCFHVRGIFSFKPSNIFIDCAVPTLVRQMVNSGADIMDLRAHILGGASISSRSKRNAEALINAARKALKKDRVMVSSENLGGNTGTKVVFDTWSGDIVVCRAGEEGDHLSDRGVELSRYGTESGIFADMGSGSRLSK